MRFVIVVLLVCLAVTAVYTQAQSANTGNQAARPRGGGMNLMTLGFLSQGFGSDFMKNLMYCQVLGLPPIYCMGVN